MNIYQNSQTAPLVVTQMANQVQTCFLNLQSITYRSSAISCRAVIVSQAHEVHAFICKSVTFSSTTQPFIWFSCFSYLSSQNMEFLTSSNSVVSNTFFIQTSFVDQSAYPALWRPSPMCQASSETLALYTSFTHLLTLQLMSQLYVKTFICYTTGRGFESEAPAAEEMLDRVVRSTEQFGFQMCALKVI